MKICTLLLSASVVALAWSGVAAASESAPEGQAAGADAAAAAKGPQADTVKEVVVTGERRSTALQRTPIAATVLTGKDLIRDGVFTEEQLQFVSPSLTVNNFGQGNNFDIRGIGKGEHNTQTGTGVITYRDGASSFPGYFQEEPFFDIASVEVLRGPQGTFSGQNATGGAVIINSNNPIINGGYSGYVLGHYGNYNDVGVQAAVNIPVSDTFAARVAINTEHRDTFYHFSGGPGGQISGDPNLNWGSLRLSMLWKPNAKLSVLSKLDYDYLSNGGYFGDPMAAPCCSKIFNIANNWHTSAIDQFVREILKVDYVADNGITIRSISTAATGRTSWTGDIDGTANTSPNYMIDEGVDETLLSEEINFISPNTGPLTWILGGYIQSNVYNFPANRFDVGVPSGGFDEDLFGTNRTHTWAAFGQVTYNLPKGFQVQLGARYSNWFTSNNVTYDVPEFKALWPTFLYYHQKASESGSSLTGKFTINWNIDKNNFAYAFVSSGAKPGGLNTGIYNFSTFAIQPPPAPFRQEYVTDYEIGWKSSMFDNHLHLQLGAYDSIFQHFQVNLPLANNPLLSTQQNVQGRTKLYGVEASAQAVFGDVQIDTGLGLEHSELGAFYSEDPFGPTSAAPCNPNSGPPSIYCVNLKGHPQTYAPNFTFNIGVQYNLHLNDLDKLTPRISYSHIDHQWGTLFDQAKYGERLSDRDLVGASLAWTHDAYVVTAYGYNLTNDRYISALLAPIRIAGAPRQFGVSVMKTF
jgi:iron complex outermembrane receptor protein